MELELKDNKVTVKVPTKVIVTVKIVVPLHVRLLDLLLLRRLLKKEKKNEI